MLTRKKVSFRERLLEEAYKEWLNQLPIQFPLCRDSPIRNNSNNSSSSSQVWNEGTPIKVGMDEYLQDMISMEALLLDAFYNIELGYDAHITDT